MGKSAPESSHRGIRNKLMMAWKAWLESIGQAMVKPRAVSENETRKMVSTTSRKLANVQVHADQGAKTRKIRP